MDEAFGAEPEVSEEVRSGRVQAADVIVGAAMEATRGKADAARVKNPVPERLSS